MLQDKIFLGMVMFLISYVVIFQGKKTILGKVSLHSFIKQ